MKSKLFKYLWSIVLILIFPLASRSQGVFGLNVISMPGFPVAPQDTAYEGQSYSFAITLVNNTNNVISSPIDIQFRVDSITSTAFTVSQPALGINDSATFNISGYTFNQPQFKMGNNIVVVWPVVNGVTFPVDSFYADVIFVPLSSLGGKDLDVSEIAVFPIPSKNFINIRVEPNDRVGYVRIFDLNGKTLIYLEKDLNLPIDIRHLRQGTYIFESEINGTIFRRKFIRN